MKYREEFYQGFTDHMKQAGIRNFLGSYKIPRQAITNKILDHKKVFDDYIDGKISKEEYDRLTQAFLAADPALKPKQQMLPGFDDLFKESTDRKKLPYRPTTKVILQEPDGSIVARKGKGKKSLDLPGGGIDPGETPIQALKREVKEETGITPKNIKHQKTVKWDWPEKFKGKRGEKFRGENTHIFTADVGSKGKQTSDEGDGWGKVTTISRDKATKLIAKAIKEKGSNKYPAAQAEVLDEITEKVAQLSKLIFKGKQLYHRAKNPLDMGHATLGDQAVYRIANLVSPRLGGKYRRHVQFKPHSYKDNLSRTGRSMDLRAVDKIDDVQDVMDTMGYFNNRPIKPSQQQVIGKLVDYVNKQKRIYG